MSHTIDRKRLRTVHLVPLTAFDNQNRMDLDLQTRHIARLAEAGISVYMPAAGTGEFHSLSEDEIIDQVKVTRKAAGPNAIIFAPMGGDIQRTIRVAERSMEAGADGVMFMPLTHPYLCDEGFRDYIFTVLDKVPCPTLFYKRGPVPSDQLILNMAEDSRIVGVKYAVNDLAQFRATVMADTNQKLEWICGTAERWAPFYMLVGAGGYTTGAGNVCPHLTLALHAALTAGEYQEALRLQNLILPLEDFRAKAGESFNISMLKYAMNVLGMNFGEVRPPQRRLSAEDKRDVESLAKRLLEVESEIARECSHVGLSGTK
ncbi:MAG: dihydrodipicolinate synthase family protein [Planctomycetota bacterium]|nr:dihydrodipicolinate synthase family protein [Planctomycetota bacterium]MDA1213798.1 dihydrodipicolinate synthase family protein [Planctomycetota bacterium]